MSLAGPSGTPARRSSGPLIVLMVVLGLLLLVVLAISAAVALRLGPFARPPGTPVPSTIANATDRPTEPPSATDPPRATDGPAPTARQSGDPTGEPTDEPTEAPPATAPPTLPVPPGTPLGMLLSHVPPSIWATCEEGEANDAVVTVDCAARDGTVALTYWLFGSVDEMYAEYDEIFGSALIDADSGSCYEPDGNGFRATPNRWPAEHGYTIGEVPIGRYLCLDLDRGPAIVWTDERFDILALGSATSEDIDALVEYWLSEAGPVP